MSRKSRLFFRILGSIALAGTLWLRPEPLGAQFSGFSAATIEPAREAVRLDSGLVRVPVAVRIRRGFHINSDRPNDPYLIPTKLDWNPTPLRVESIDYPPAEEVEYDFSAKPLSVYSSRIEIITTFRIESPPRNLAELRGALRFQACNDEACLPPRTIPVVVPIRR